MMRPEIADRVADAAVGVSVGSTTATALVVNIATVNQWLQAVAFLVAIISGLCASWYYISNRKKSDAS